MNTENIEYSIQTGISVRKRKYSDRYIDKKKEYNWIYQIKTNLSIEDILEKSKRRIISFINKDIRIETRFQEDLIILKKTDWYDLSTKSKGLWSK